MGKQPSCTQRPSFPSFLMAALVELLANSCIEPSYSRRLGQNWTKSLLRSGQVTRDAVGSLKGGLFLFCFVFLLSSLAFVASVAFVGVWLLWLYHALPIYLSIYLT